MPDLVSKTHFNKAPTINKRRTRFDLSHSILTTFNTGDFVPVFVEPVYPGETHSLRTSSLVRLETSLHQTMDNAYFEEAFFFVPDKVLWTNFDKFLGANDDAWTQTTEYNLPQINLEKYVLVDPTDPEVNYHTEDVVVVNSLLNHLMFPAGSYGNSDGVFLSYDQLPLRGVFKIYNDWYRDENYDSIIYYDDGDTDIDLGTGFLFNGSYFYPAASNLKVNRFKDLFSTALPAPQKGQEVSIGLVGTAPIIADTSLHDMGNSLMFGGSTISSGYNRLPLLLSVPAGGLGGSNYGVVQADQSNPSNSANHKDVDKTNLLADLSNSSAITINQLRLSIAAQAIAERDARGGTRMKEKIYATWGVHVNDLEIDRSEFLGGKRIPVSMMEVLQTSETGTTVLGTDAGHSKTVDSSESFVRSFTQYGWIIGFCYVRTSRTYSQGIDRKFRNKDLYSLFDPMLDNIGELAIEKSELYALATQNQSAVNNAKAVFGYQEAWYHLKERTNRFSGYFQPAISQTLDSWHYGDSYNSLPQASASWLKEGASNVDRTIAVSSEASFQWSVNLYFEYYATREMAKYSIPNTFGF